MIFGVTNYHTISPILGIFTNESMVIMTCLIIPSIIILIPDNNAMTVSTRLIRVPVSECGLERTV